MTIKFSGTFTDAFIRSLKAAENGKSYKITEKAPKGEGRLMVRVLGSGLKQFFYRYRSAGGDTLMSLGRYGPDRSLADIRAACRLIREKQLVTGDVKRHEKEEAARHSATPEGAVLRSTGRNVGDK